MQLDWNVSSWNWNQFQAVGKHVGSYIAGAVTIAVAFHFLSPGTTVNPDDISENINHVLNGLQETAKGVAGLMATLVFIYNSLKSASKASPKEQITSVVTNLSAPEVTQVANAIADPEGRKKLINAVAEMPEVNKIEAIPSVANATSSEKVVSQKG